MRVRYYFRHLMVQQRAAALIEFAFMGPLVILVILGVLQIGVAGWAKSTLENSLRDAARFGVTGGDDEATGELRAAAIVTRIEQKMAGFPRDTSTPILLTTKVYPSFEDIGRPEPEDNGNGVCETGEHFTDLNGNGVFDIDAAKTGFGGSNEVVMYTVEFPLKAVVPLIGDYLVNTGLFRLKATTAAQNEPFALSGPEPLVLPC